MRGVIDVMAVHAVYSSRSVRLFFRARNNLDKCYGVSAVRKSLPSLLDSSIGIGEFYTEYSMRAG